jgi:hypothetical protein
MAFRSELTSWMSDVCQDQLESPVSAYVADDEECPEEGVHASPGESVRT